jgi:uncharacterized protein
VPRPIHFEIPADRPERAMAFYEKVFGWKFEKWDGPSPYWMVQTGGEGPGIDGGLRGRTHPNEGPLNTIDVSSCDDYLRKIAAAGGKTLVPKMAIPGVGWLAYCADSEGNGFGIMQADESATS